MDVTAMGIVFGKEGTGFLSFGKQVEKQVEPQLRISPFFHETLIMLDEPGSTKNLLRK